MIERSPAKAGLFFGCGHSPHLHWDQLRHCGNVHHRLRGRAPSVFRQDLRRRFLAGTAARGDTELRLQAPQVCRTVFSGGPDLLVGNSVADADVHENQPVSAFERIQTQMRMIVNSIKYNPLQRNRA